MFRKRVAYLGLASSLMLVLAAGCSRQRRSGVTKEKVIGPGGVAVDYSWDYAQTRSIVEAAAARRRYRVKTVLRKKAAQY